MYKPRLANFYLPAYEDGTDRVFRNVGIQNSDAGELPKRKHTISDYPLNPLLRLRWACILFQDPVRTAQKELSFLVVNKRQLS
jgi:hypothetical protein